MGQLSVFGGTGFVGSHFVRLRPDSVVNARDDYAPKTGEIVYFISTTDNYNVFEDVFLDVETNVTTLLKVLKNCRPPCTFNFISSWFVYGDTDLPARETSHCDPKGFYSITKRAAEQLLESYCRTFGLNYRILRLANVVGRDDRKVSKKKNALQFLIQEMKAGEEIALYDNGNFIRDYIHVEDAARAIRLVVEKGEPDTIYNIGNGVPIVFRDAIDYVRRKLASRSGVGVMEPTPFHKIIQVKSMYMDNSRIRALGYQPEYGFERMLDDLL